ncbi:hypothetical protein CJ030_MR3G001120 [Morella rubra]|uniref:Uncharacterized protein n=1 Tax=Morella rubra TaxID=262757 RepID=A0A6A1W5L7_9ROSI|nr:hypothetical protein CJ030_MR3G001120 [Morella rubra]
MAEMEGINPNIKRRGSNSISNPEGFKTREPKHKGNKQLKSGLEQRSSRGHSRARGRGVSRALSQPVSRRLQLLDELEASNEEEDNDEDDDGEDELLSGRFRSLDEL